MELGKPNFLTLFSIVLLVGCDMSSPDLGVEETTPVLIGDTRYAFNNQCIALKHEGQFVIADGGNFRLGALVNAEPVYFKPSALGKYLLYSQTAELLQANQPVDTVALANAHDDAEWTLLGLGDNTEYPLAPVVDVNTSAETIEAYRAFIDPELRFTEFTLQSNTSAAYLAVDAEGILTTTAEITAAASFQLERLDAASCAEFPEISTNTVGQTYSGTAPDGKLLGFADSHLHATSTTFLGGAKPGWSFHKFGVTHALHDCAEQHGPDGTGDPIGALFTNDFDGHDTRGWPLFPDWPNPTATTHEATYWKWIERAWMAGLRVILNYAVDNETLCEITRNANQDLTRNCNEMVNAAQQISTAYAMQDYIDAQYGGPGKGWWRIVTNPEQARAVVAEGKAAVILGIEVSNLLNCSVTYVPTSTQEAFEETGDPTTGGHLYGCSMEETGAENEILTQLQELKRLGVSGLFTIHEFDNAFGGNDIFDGFVLNLGTKENSGGISAADNAAAQGIALDAAQADATTHIEPNGVASGEYWSTYDCPGAGHSNVGDGFVFGRIGSEMTNLGPPPPACQYQGQGGRPGGATACYPGGFQCNARLLTPMGLYLFEKVMELGFIFEIDHLAFDVKNQLLDLAEHQTMVYPTVSGHGFAGLTNQQAKRIFEGGGLVYPSLNHTKEFIQLWTNLKAIWRAAGRPYEFGFSFGSDTNGLSPQSFARSEIEPGKEVQYPYSLFSGDVFEGLSEFDAIEPVQFLQPQTLAPDGSGRSWHIDQHGHAHYGMASGFVEELRIEGSAEQMRDLYRSAETYIQFWERTELAAESIRENGFKVPENLLQEAPHSQRDAP